MHQELKGQVAVITGGSGAIGGAIGLALQQAGATAIAFDLHTCGTLPRGLIEIKRKRPRKSRDRFQLHFLITAWRDCSHIKA